MAKSDGFYKKLDEYKRSKSSCTCFNFAVLMIFILIMAELTLFYIGRGVRAVPEDTTVGKIDYTEAQFARLETEKEFEVVITEAILCSKISGQRQQENLSCRISDKGVVVSGKIATFLPANSSLEVIPKVESGVLQFAVGGVRIGRFKVANFLAPTIAGALNSAISPELGGVRVDRIDLSEGIMVIIGERKSE